MKIFQGFIPSPCYKLEYASAVFAGRERRTTISRYTKLIVGRSIRFRIRTVFAGGHVDGEPARFHLHGTAQEHDDVDLLDVPHLPFEQYTSRSVATPPVQGGRQWADRFLFSSAGGRTDGFFRHRGVSAAQHLQFERHRGQIHQLKTKTENANSVCCC